MEQVERKLISANYIIGKINFEISIKLQTQAGSIRILHTFLNSITRQVHVHVDNEIIETSFNFSKRLNSV